MNYDKQTLDNAMWLFELLEDCEDDVLFDIKESVRDLVTCIRKNPEELIKALNTKANIIEETLVEHDICPECGGELEWVRDGYNYVPYGSTYVPESSYGHRECSCGFSVDD